MEGFQPVPLSKPAKEANSRLARYCESFADIFVLCLPSSSSSFFTPPSAFSLMWHGFRRNTIFPPQAHCVQDARSRLTGQLDGMAKRTFDVSHRWKRTRQGVFQGWQMLHSPDTGAGRRTDSKQARRRRCSGDRTESPAGFGYISSGGLTDAFKTGAPKCLPTWRLLATLRRFKFASRDRIFVLIP